MKDKNGYDFAELVATQDTHLALWRERLKPKLADEIEGYVKWANRKADGEGKHRVFRGQDLVEIIRTWPVLGEAYPVKTYEGI